MLAARTFSLASEAAMMRSAGLFSGFTPRDLLVIDDDPASPGFGAAIDNRLHDDEEPARHKLLDLVGDLALVGRPILGEVHARKSGHRLHHEAARVLLDAFGADSVTALRP